MPPNKPNYTVFTLLLLVNSFGLGTVVDLCIRHFSGKPIPPLFTIAWGSGAIFFTILISKKSAQWHASNLSGIQRKPVEHNIDRTPEAAPQSTPRQPANIDA